MTAPRPGGPGGVLSGGALPAGLREALAAFAARPDVLVALDFDGCLAPLVPDPEDSRPVPAARDALHLLARLPGTAVALVSGRPLESLRRLADPPPAARLVGRHGGELAVPPQFAAASGPGADGGGPGPEGADGGADLAPEAVALLDRLEAAVAAIVAEHPDTWMERKPAAAVLHTRRAGRDVASAATARLLAGPATWPGVHAMSGKEVVELAVTDVTKGAALRRLRVVAGVPAPGGVLYAGDDVTDERAFAVLDDAAGDVTVKVGDGATAARHRVADPDAVAAVLQHLVALRGRS